MTDEADTTVGEAQKDPAVRSGMAAARLSSMVGALIENVQDASGVRKGQIAGAMGVSAGRVSQIINGDGNVRIATLGRFLEACGYELELVARPKSGDGTVIRLPRKGRRRRNGRPEGQQVVPASSAGFQWVNTEEGAEIGDVASVMFPPDQVSAHVGRTAWWKQ